MKLFNIIFAIAALLVTGIEKGYAQQSFYSVANTRYLDSVEQVIANYICNDSLVYAAGYKKKLLEKETPVLEVLNNFFDSTFEADRVSEELIKIRYGKIRYASVSKTETNIGLLKVIHIIINGPYLHADVTLDCIGNSVIRKRSILSSNIKGRCGLH